MGRPYRNDLYRAVWRWHFYAGLLVLPVLAWLAVTGGLFVFKTQIDGYFHQELKSVPARGVPLADGALAAAALAAHPGEPRKYTPAATPTDSAELLVTSDAGARLSVFVDPYDGRVLGTLPEGGSVAWTIRKLHSLAYFGTVARGIVEIAAGWAVLLVVSGLYLWWPRGRRGGVTTVRGRPSKRVFWRDLHAVTGVLAGAALVFLALTGMPWSVLWGAQINQWANGHNFGYPAGVRVQVPMSEQRLREQGPTTWSLDQARMPMSMPAEQGAHAGHHGHEGHAAHQEHQRQGNPTGAPVGPQVAAGGIGLDAAVAAFRRLGLAPGFSVGLPQGPTGVYTGSVYPPDLALQRVVHLDRYSGQALVDMRYADYGFVGRWLEWGINVHLGQEFGVPNQAVLIVACLAIVLLCTSAVVMWWKRRPTGGIGVPPLPHDRFALLSVVVLLAVGGILFPLVGASLLLMAAADWLFVARPAARGNAWR